MSEANKPNPSLSEISHLFLSSVRERQTSGTPRPTRVPPKMRQQLPELTAEELAQVEKQRLPEEEPISQVAPMSAVIAGNLHESLLDHARQFAAQMATTAGRIGLIQIDSAELRVLLYEQNPHGGSTADLTNSLSEPLDARRMTEVLNELSWDVDRWLVAFSSVRSQEARSLLKKIQNWVLLSTSDHEGVVACYRTLKGLSEIHKPTLSVAMVETTSSENAQKAFRKLKSVTQQFLGWSIRMEGVVGPAKDISEHLVLGCGGSHDKAQLASAPQWDVVSQFADRAVSLPQPSEESAPRAPMATRHVVDISIPELSAMSADEELLAAHVSVPLPVTAPQPVETPALRMPAMEVETVSEVFDLPEHDATPANIAAAILRNRGGELIECPITPPMCPEARLAVRRDKCLVLIAVASQGLADLRSIGQAFQWMLQNRPLIAMAVPQLSIDPHQMPQLNLLVNQQDMSADILQPMLQSGHVTVHAYRKLRWGAKTGLLLEAA